MSKWFAKFCAGDFSLDDDPQSGRLVEVDSDQMETLRTINIIPCGDSQNTKESSILH